MSFVIQTRGLLALTLAATLAACGTDGMDGRDGIDGENGADGVNGVDGQNGVDGATSLVRTTTVDPGVDCAFGGVQIEHGLDDNGNGTLEDTEVDGSELLCNADPADTVFMLQVLHSSDNESSWLNPNTLEPKVENYSAVLDGLQQLAAGEGVASLHLTAGDHTLPNPFFQASAEIGSITIDGTAVTIDEPGVADILAYNEMMLTANGIGNHEFDGGDGDINVFAQMLDAANYPFLAANLDFSGVTLDAGTPAIEIGTDGDNVANLAGKVARSAYVEVTDGTGRTERIGLIGRAPADFFNVIAGCTPGVACLGGLDFVGGRSDVDNQPLTSAVIQVLEQVAVLEAQGVDKIILLDHAQDFTGDPLSAENLRGIDIIVAAGSTGFMARPFADGPFNLLRDGDAPGANYPTVRFDSEGERLVVVNSDQLWTYVGNLIVGFDALGRIAYIDPRSGPVATNDSGIEALETELGLAAGGLPAIQGVSDIAAALEATSLIDGLFTEIGTTTSSLNGLRADVRTRETNLGRLAADSTLWFAQAQRASRGVDVALKNGGGIRDTIEGPSIIGLTVGSALAFNNGIAVVDLTGEQFLATMENAVSRNPAADGRFPQVAGMSLVFDPAQPGVEGATTLTTASRLVELEVTLSDGTLVDFVTEGTVNASALSETITMATNSFLLTGGDGYNSLAAGTNAEIVTETDFKDGDDPKLENGEQEVLVSYIVDELGGVVDIQDPPPSARVRLPPTPPFVSEIHYDNSGPDTGEFIEISGGFGIDLSGWSLELVNGSDGAVYNTVALTGVVADQSGGLGAVAFTFPSNGLQDGSPDGFALVDPDGNVVEFLSYEGTITATDGAAVGLTSTDLGVSEPGSDAAGMSLQLVDGVWTGPLAESPGTVN